MICPIWTQLFVSQLKINSLTHIIILHHNYSCCDNGLSVRLGSSEIPGFEPHLYLTPDHILTQTTEPVFAFNLFRPGVPHPVAIFQCSKQSETDWQSPAHAPFGGLQCSIDCCKHELDFMLHFVIQWIKRDGGKKLLIKTAPSCYNPDSHCLLSQCYLNTGFRQIQAYLNSFILIKKESFVSCIEPAEQRRLRKSHEAGFRAGLADDISNECAFQFLLKCRERSGYKLSINLAQIAELREKFADRFLVFAVREASVIIALTLAVKVNSHVLYNFLCADLLEYRAYSPTVMLIEGLYNYCQQNGIDILDLGISLDQDGNFKPSLHRFKQNIGAQDCVKETYEILI